MGGEGEEEKARTSLLCIEHCKPTCMIFFNPLKLYNFLIEIILI